MSLVLVLPGIGSSGPEHWQSLWEAASPEFRRVEMPDWDRPELEAWLRALERKVAEATSPPVIVAHSLGCLAVAHFAARGGHLQAALLVAVPDPEGPTFPEEARGFGPVPLLTLPFATRVVASRTDPYGSLVFAERCAKAWGSEFFDIGAAGHINAQSGLGAWPEGHKLLAGLLG